MPGTAPIPAPSATLLLLRDGPGGLEVLMMCRSEASSFAPGAYVFPGGRVGPEDEVLARFCASCEATDSPALARRIAAIRETYEECGILLARRPAGKLLSRIDVRPGMSLTDGSLELATDLLVPFAHWITPASRPKRFDTWFFLARAPDDQVAAHDGHEATDTVWLRPADVLAKADAEAVKLVFVTRMNLIKLGRSRTVAEAMAAAASSSIVTVIPEVVQTADGPAFQIPEAADYGITHLPVGNIPRA
jgi:8-oxo-dGTP pyrophosphatase MutT (NUDIX family)